MGKVISLKLNKQEERIVRRLNQEGMTNSELLRSALWNYFKPTDYSADPIKNHQDNISRDDALNNIKQEVIQLKENHNKVQSELTQEIDRLREHLSESKPLVDLSIRKELTPREEYVMNIHKNIDEILSRK